MTMRKRKSKRRRRQSQTTTSPPNAPSQKRRLPAPQVNLHKFKVTSRRSTDVEDNPIVDEIVRLHAELCRVSGRSPFTVWRDWLDTTEPWLRLVGIVGEVGAMAGLPPEVQEKYDRLDQLYTQAAARHPAAHRKMGETFTTIFRILADAYPAIDLERCGRPGQLNPDILGQAFIASLGYPQAWLGFFPVWSSCIALARNLAPDNMAETIYNELGQAHLRAHLAGAAVATPHPGEDESWAVWLEAIRPFYEPLLIGPGLIFSSTMLLALASRFPSWITRNGLVKFAWPDIEADPVLNRITSITAMLYGLNGFYAGKSQGNLEAIAHIETAIEQETSATPSSIWRHPAAVYHQRPHPEEQAAPAEPENLPSPAAPSFSALFKRG